jgi:hypothetical protein
VSEDSSTYTLTFKGGKDFSDPWLVVRGDSVADVESALDELSNGLVEKFALAAKLVHSQVQGGNAAVSQSLPSVAPQPQAQAPAPSPWDETPATAPGTGFTAAPAYNFTPQAQPQGQGGPAGGPAKDDPYYAPKQGQPFDAQPAPQGPPGDKSGIPMTWRTGVGQKGPWRAWMSGQDRNTPQHLKDSPIFYR